MLGVFAKRFALLCNRSIIYFSVSTPGIVITANIRHIPSGYGGFLSVSSRELHHAASRCREIPLRRLVIVLCEHRGP